MYMWWPRIIPYLGFTWVYCDRYGNRGKGDAKWETEVLILAWLDRVIVLWQPGLPQRVDKR